MYKDNSFHQNSSKNCLLEFSTNKQQPRFRDVPLHPDAVTVVMWTLGQRFKSGLTFQVSREWRVPVSGTLERNTWLWQVVWRPPGLSVQNYLHRATGQKDEHTTPTPIWTSTTCVCSFSTTGQEVSSGVWVGKLVRLKNWAEATPSFSETLKVDFVFNRCVGQDSGFWLRWQR